jgi:hypothetical protein
MLVSLEESRRRDPRDTVHADGQVRRYSTFFTITTRKSLENLGIQHKYLTSVLGLGVFK